MRIWPSRPSSRYPTRPSRPRPPHAPGAPEERSEGSTPGRPGEPIPHQALETTAPNLVRLGLLRRQDAPRVAKALVSADVDLLEMKSGGTMEDGYRRLTRPA